MTYQHRVAKRVKWKRPSLEAVCAADGHGRGHTNAVLAFHRFHFVFICLVHIKRQENQLEVI